MQLCEVLRERHALFGVRYAGSLGLTLAIRMGARLGLGTAAEVAGAAVVEVTSVASGLSLGACLRAGCDLAGASASGPSAGVGHRQVGRYGARNDRRLGRDRIGDDRRISGALLAGHRGLLLIVKSGVLKRPRTGPLPRPR